MLYGADVLETPICRTGVKCYRIAGVADHWTFVFYIVDFAGSDFSDEPQELYPELVRKLVPKKYDEQIDAC
jgi:hypothetical protein